MKYLSYGVMVYMLLALIWWTILLSKNNTKLYEKNKEINYLTNNINKTVEAEKIYKDFLRNKYMILGEGMVFGISLILGLWFIQQAYTREVKYTTNQKNFLLSITHELKSPIAAIHLITETLIKRKLPNEKILDLQQSILSETSRLEKLINNLLLATKIESGYQKANCGGTILTVFIFFSLNLCRKTKGRITKPSFYSFDNQFFQADSNCFLGRKYRNEMGWTGCSALPFSSPLPLLSAQPEGVALRHITTDDGLSHNLVTCIAKDTQGFMWFGTADGLTRFDSKRCVVFRHVKSDTNSLPHSGINGLALDPLGRMWVATADGLCWWDYANRKFHRLNFRLPGWNKSAGLWALSFDKNGGGWAVSDSFLIRLDYHALELAITLCPTG